jgi:hypothetical protein
MEESQVSINIGSQELRKGEIREGKQLVAWDCVQDCVPDVCPIGRKCLYAERSLSRKGGGRCALQVEYLQAFVDMIFTTYRYLDDGDTYKVGMMLVPLYSQLCRQKIVEKGVEQLAYEDAKGVTRIHPIYKEMRETMKTITTVWKEMGFKVPVNPSLPAGALPTGNSVYKHGGFGDPTHYATISQGADNKRNLIR